MPNIVISGSLFDIANKLGRIKQVIANRVAVGYERFQHEEEWIYHTAHDLNVCPTCDPLHGTIYRGDYLISDFPFSVSVDSKKVWVNNQTDFHASDRCRCDATWINAHEVLVSRLATEMENA